MVVIGVTLFAVGQPRPDAESLEDQPRAVRQRERTVAARRRALRAGVERDDIEIRVGDRQRQRAADRARADDDDVMHRFGAGGQKVKNVRKSDARRRRSSLTSLRPYLLTSSLPTHAASTSATVFGVAAVRFS